MAGMIRKAAEADLDGVAAVYEALFDKEDREGSWTNWKRGVYPTRETAAGSLARGELFVYEEEGKILASMRINHEQPDCYAQADWKYPAEGDEVMVIHTLCVDPAKAGCGIGQEMLAYGKAYGKSIGCKVFRFDTFEGNRPAAALYEKLGYPVVAVVETLFEGSIHENLNLYECLL